MVQPVLSAFNRGIISPLALARTDFKRTALSAEIQTNWMPRTLGSMMLRPGGQFTGATRGNARSVSIPFIFSTQDTARIELTGGMMRVWVNDALVSRLAVTTAVTNGAFDTDLSGWTDADTGSAVSAWAVGGYMSLLGTGTGAAIRRQQVTVADIGVRHALNVVVNRGPCVIKVGSASGGDQYVSETTLSTGSHSLAFTPTGDFWVEFSNFNTYPALVDSCVVAAAGVMEIVAPWIEADLSLVRWDQSGDVIFVACSGYQQRRIERRASDSWSIVTYQSDNGPFRIQNVGATTITPSAVSGDVTLTASAPIFKAGMIGTLFRLNQGGQSASVVLTGDNQFSDPIRVVGVGGTRTFAVIITGTWTGTITLQYSVGAPGDWVDATSGTYTVNTSISYNDTLDNQIIYYRIGFKSGGYGTGTANALLSYSSGTSVGIARITGFISSTVVNAQAVDAFGSVTATSDWSESYWSDYRGWPSAVAFYEGRLWWAGKDRIWGSVSDSFANYDDTVEGDSGPISRSIGSGPVDRINWLLPMQRLLLGADGSIWSARSSSFDEPLTPSNFNLKDVSGQGSSTVAAAKIDTNGAFVQRSGVRIYEASYDGNSYDYGAVDLTSHVPEVGEPSIIKVVVQRQPETRMHCIRSDGTVAILIFDKTEDVNCWVIYETAGDVEDAVVLPAQSEDQVYYTVRRTINGSDVRYHEKWAMEAECQGGAVNRQGDSFTVGAGAAAGLSHLEGAEVVCWADGTDRGVFTVSGGAIPITATAWMVGLPYEARFKSTKLVYGADVRSGLEALCAKKRVNKLGVIARNMHPRGLVYGPDFDTMDDLPAVELAGDIDLDQVWTSYDEELFSFPGDWNTDSRICLKASAPRPVTLLACVIEMETNA